MYELILQYFTSFFFVGVLSRHFTWSDRIMFGLNDFGGYYNYYGRVPEGSDDPPPKAEFFSWGGREPNNAQEHCHVVIQFH